MQLLLLWCGPALLCSLSLANSCRAELVSYSQHHILYWATRMPISNVCSCCGTVEQHPGPQRSIYKTHLDWLLAPLQVSMSLACGSVAGLVSSTATFPLDLIRRRMQLQGQGGCKVHYTSYSHAFSTVIRREGFQGLYHGILPEYYKVVPGVAIAFCTYELMKSMLGVQTNVSNR